MVWHADMDDERGNPGATQKKKRASRRRYGPWKARDFNHMDNFEVLGAFCHPAEPASAHVPARMCPPCAVRQHNIVGSACHAVTAHVTDCQQALL